MIEIAGQGPAQAIGADCEAALPVRADDDQWRLDYRAAYIHAETHYLETGDTGKVRRIFGLSASLPLTPPYADRAIEYLDGARDGFGLCHWDIIEATNQG
jgi:hypothetical protein